MFDSGDLNLGPVFSICHTIPLGSVDLYNEEFPLTFGSEQTTLLYA